MQSPEKGEKWGRGGAGDLTKRCHLAEKDPDSEAKNKADPKQKLGPKDRRPFLVFDTGNRGLIFL